MVCAHIPKLDSSAPCFIQSRTLGREFPHCPRRRAGPRGAVHSFRPQCPRSIPRSAAITLPVASRHHPTVAALVLEHAAAPPFSQPSDGGTANPPSTVSSTGPTG